MEAAISISFQSPRHPRTAQAEKETPESHPSLSSFLIFPFPLLGKGKGPKTPGGG